MSQSASLLSVSGVSSSAAPSRQSATSVNSVYKIAKDLIELQRNSATPKSSASRSSKLSKSASARSFQSSSSKYLSKIEESILKSNVPIEIKESEEIEANGLRGIYANKSEAENWKGPVPLTDYKVRKDAAPVVVTKKPEQKLKYVQEIAIRYLKPPTPAPPGDLVIIQDPDVEAPPTPYDPCSCNRAPKAQAPKSPEPFIIRQFVQDVNPCDGGKGEKKYSP